MSVSEHRSIALIIPSWLDEMRLSLAQFRVFSHLSRRAGKDRSCYPAMPSVIATCRISEPTFWKVLNELEAIGLITRENRPGSSNLYFVAIEPPKKSRRVNSESSEGGAPSLKGLVPPKKEGWVSPKTKGFKGSPNKGSPPKEVQSHASNSAPIGTASITTNKRTLSFAESVSLAEELHEKARHDSDALFGTFPPEEIAQWAGDWFHKLESEGWRWKGSDVHNPKANLSAYLRGCARNQSKRFKELAWSGKDGEEPPF